MNGRALALFLAVYGSTLAALLPRLSLWLDEVLDLIGARKDTLTQVWEYAAQNAGGVPFGYFYGFVSIRALGYSVFAGRLPSLLASLVACAGLYVLARRLGARFPLLAVAIFALLPLQFRYALEARPYGPALALAIWSTVAFLRLLDRPDFRMAELYSVLVIAGLFTQPYSIFIPAAHLAWLILFRRDWNALRYVLPSLVFGCIFFFPWYRYAAPFWKAEITTYAIHPQFDWKEAQLLFKELVGLGYLGTILVLTAAVVGFRSLARENRALWALLLAIPILGAVTANLVLGYFLAIRQVIYVLLPLSVLVGLGIEELWRNRKAASGALAALLIGASLFEDARAFTRPRENWEAAANQLAATSAANVCVMAVPSDSWKLYQFFQPQLHGEACLDHAEAYREIVVAESPYESAALIPATEEKLRSHGWTQTKEDTFNGPRLVYFSRSR